MSSLSIALSVNFNYRLAVLTGERPVARMNHGADEEAREGRDYILNDIVPGETLKTEPGIG